MTIGAEAFGTAWDRAYGTSMSVSSLDTEGDSKGQALIEFSIAYL